MPCAATASAVIGDGHVPNAFCTSASSKPTIVIALEVVLGR
jgi:hypothetical protein